MDRAALASNLNAATRALTAQNWVEVIFEIRRVIQIFVANNGKEPTTVELAREFVRFGEK